MYKHYHIWNMNNNNLNKKIYSFGLIFLSINLFSVSIKEITKLYSSTNNNDNLKKYLILLNGSIALFSGLTFCVAVKEIIKND